MAQAQQHTNPGRDIMKQAGPEDKLQMKTGSTPSSWRLGDVSAVVGSLDKAEQLEVQTLTAFLTTAPYKGIMQSLMQSRNLCTRERYGQYVCEKTQPEHLASAGCAAASLETLKCGIKL